MNPEAFDDSSDDDGRARGGGPWEDGRRAWGRLNGWHQDQPVAVPGHPDSGHGALKALEDIGLVRRLLDQAELIAVKTARRHGKSWAEIATMLGVTRQSAWERWRDLDASAEPAAGAERKSGLIPAEILERATQEMIGRSAVVVPDVIGMTVRAAQKILRQWGFVAVAPDPDGPPLAALGWSARTVIDQSPESGATAQPGSPVIVWVDGGGGGSGVREPRRPKPISRSAREMRYEPSDQPMG